MIGDLDAAAELVAANYVLELLPTVRRDLDDEEDFAPMPVKDLLATFTQLANDAEQVVSPVEMRTFTAVIRPNGRDAYVKAEGATPEELANAMLVAAAEYLELQEAQARAADQFIALWRIANRDGNE